MDLIDFLFKTILEAVAWVFGLIIKLIMGLISGIFSAIGNLFKGDSSGD